MATLDVESRPAIARVAALPASYGLKPAERLVLLALACDSYDGETSAPGMDALAAWTGLFRSAAYDAVNSLSVSNDRRPALIERTSTRGRNRTVFRLLLQPSDSAGRLDAAPPVDNSPQPSGEPSDTAGRLDTSSPVDNSSQPSGEPSGQPSGQPSGEPSGTTGLHPSLPFPANPPTPHELAAVNETGGWAGEECDARRDPRGAHELDADNLACIHCQAHNPAITTAERDAIIARRKLTALRRDRALPIDLDELMQHAARLGDGDPLAGYQIVERVTERTLAGTGNPAAVLRSRLQPDGARRVQAA